MTRLAPRLRFVVLATALVVATMVGLSAERGVSGVEPGAATAPPPLFETRVRSVSIEGASLAQADVRVEMALRASRNLTVRRLSFSESAVEGMPVWIDEVEGNWRLRAGEEFLLPGTLRARVSALDVLQMEHLAQALRRRAVTVRTTVEVTVATPWTARLFFADATRTALMRAEVEVPIETGSTLQPMLALTAALGERVRERLAPLLSNLRDLTPARRALLDGAAPSIARVDVDYELRLPNGERRARTHRALGFAWNATTLCTTHEALEPWRFDFTEAALMQVQGARLVQDRVRVGIAWPGASADSSSTAGLVSQALRVGPLPPGRERTVFTPVDERARRVTVIDRDSPSNIVCLAAAAPRAPAAWTAAGVATSDDVAVFVPRAARGLTLAWTTMSPTAPGSMGTRLIATGATPTSATPTAATPTAATPTAATLSRGAMPMRLAAPMSRESYGSPLVSSSGLRGLLLSERHVAPVDDIARAAARPVAVTQE
jgi:hypothetical protein